MTLLSDNVYMVTVTATDPAGHTDTIDVTITVTDVNEAPTFTDEDMEAGCPRIANQSSHSG